MFICFAVILILHIFSIIEHRSQSEIIKDLNMQLAAHRIGYIMAFKGIDKDMAAAVVFRAYEINEGFQKSERINFLIDSLLDLEQYGR